MSAKIRKSDEEWRAQLSDLAYHVTREKGTERARTHDNFPKTPGIFKCVCCKTPLFDNAAKFDSGTGWPSFFQPITPQSVEEKVDKGWFMTRTEIICATCDAHLGHMFNDGPQPTGLRYCMNGVAMDFDES